MSSKKPHSVEEWLTQVKSRWEKIPKYKADPERLGHLGVVCDGNRRAAVEKGLDNPLEGHRAGREVFHGIAEAAHRWEIKTVTFWVFSTENWKRRDGTVPFLMKFFQETLKELDLKELNEKGVRFRHLGRKDGIEPPLLRLLRKVENKTAKNTPFNLNIAIDYGGRDELVRAFQKMVAEKIPPGKINEQLISSYLDTAGLPDPDLIIRTGAEFRTSGFMPFQSVYSEWFFTPIYFPNLTPQDILTAIQDFEKRERRFGGDEAKPSKTKG